VREAARRLTYDWDAGLLRALGAASPTTTPLSAGLNLLAELPYGWDEASVVDGAEECGLAVEPVGPMRYAPGPPALLMGFARLPRHRADQAVRALASALGARGELRFRLETPG
ncbi:hypothetical protein ACWCSH_29985, partial [Streptosporangium sp. NPDC001682]